MNLVFPQAEQKRSLLIDTAFKDQRFPKLILTTCVRKKLEKCNILEGFVEHACSNGEYFKSNLYKDHFHVRCLSHELIVIRGVNDNLIVKTFHLNFNKDIKLEPCENLLKSPISVSDNLWKRGVLKQPARPSTTSPSSSVSRIDISKRPESTSPPLVEHFTKLSNSPFESSPLRSVKSRFSFDSNGY